MQKVTALLLAKPYKHLPANTVVACILHPHQLAELKGGELEASDTGPMITCTMPTNIQCLIPLNLLYRPKLVHRYTLNDQIDVLPCGTTVYSYDDSSQSYISFSRNPGRREPCRQVMRSKLYHTGCGIVRDNIWIQVHIPDRAPVVVKSYMVKHNHSTFVVGEIVFEYPQSVTANYTAVKSRTRNYIELLPLDVLEFLEYIPFYLDSPPMLPTKNTSIVTPDTFRGLKHKCQPVTIQNITSDILNLMLTQAKSHIIPDHVKASFGTNKLIREYRSVSYQTHRQSGKTSALIKLAKNTANYLMLTLFQPQVDQVHQDHPEVSVCTFNTLHNTIKGSKCDFSTPVELLLLDEVNIDQHLQWLIANKVIDANTIVVRLFT